MTEQKSKSKFNQNKLTDGMTLSIVGAAMCAIFVYQMYQPDQTQQRSATVYEIENKQSLQPMVHVKLDQQGYTLANTNPADAYLQKGDRIKVKVTYNRLHQVTKIEKVLD